MIPPMAPKKKSALDLTIKGSMGDFVVSDESVSSVRVHYLLSHIGLELEGDHQERLLSRIAPFREVYDPRTLDFDQIMQRDIDDSRVSTELIPYLLKQSDAGLVKLFPPIIVVLLPTDSSGKPAPYYPKVEETTIHEHNVPYNLIRSGAVGQEVFELRQWLVDGVAQAHDYAQLSINTNRCKLVIVDGQHRAMSLLALYRNIKKWPENTRNVEPYYRIWTPDRIAKFDLDRAKMPIMFCVFPQLDGRQSGMELKVHSACRSIFLALNKSARPVTRSRNILLDDRDLVAMFLRGVLGYIKDLNIGSTEAIRLSAIELDNDKDRSVLKSPVAITGVTHLNGLVERLMLADAPAPGLTIRSQNLWLKKQLAPCFFERLGVHGRLPPGAEKVIRRDSCDRDSMTILEEEFVDVYLPVIVRGLDAFAPYLVHHEAAAMLYSKLEAGATSDFYRAILFEGEGMNRVFSEFQKKIDEMLQEGEFDTPELRQSREDFRARQANLEQEIDGFHGDRAARLLSGVPKAIAGRIKVRAWVTDELYADTLTTAAFQNALFLSFFGVIEQINTERAKAATPVESLMTEEVLSMFEGYLVDINEFFLPKKLEGLANLVAVFHGELRSDGTLIATNFNLKKILLPTELRPDEWPKFRAMLCELWRPDHPEAAALLEVHRGVVRRQAVSHYIEREVKEFCKDKAIRPGDMSESVRALIERSCAGRLAKGLAALGANVSAAELLSQFHGSAPVDQQEEGPVPVDVSGVAPSGETTLD